MLCALCGKIKIIKDLIFQNSFFLRYVALAFIGLANAIPAPIMCSTLSVWLTELEFQKETIGLFALLGIPFSLKILWTPFIDYVNCPILPHHPRKGWVIFSFLGIALAILGMSFVNPETQITLLIFFLICLSLLTGCLYIAGVAYEIESLPENSYGQGSSSIITGYRIGLLCSGAGTLYISSLWGWPFAFRLLSLVLFCCSLLILYLPEPPLSKQILIEKRTKRKNYDSIYICFWNEVIAKPLMAFFKNPQWIKIFAILLLFKAGDHISKMMIAPFYLSLGFTKADLASATKLWGLIATICGAFAVAPFLKNRNPFLCLGVIGFLHACTLPLFSLFFITGKSLITLYATVAFENATSGMAMTIFITCLWNICRKEYAAVQYALLWSFFCLKGDLLSCCGGILAQQLSWHAFYFITAFCGILSSLAIWLIVQRMAREHFLEKNVFF